MQDAEGAWCQRKQLAGMTSASPVCVNSKRAATEINVRPLRPRQFAYPGAGQKRQLEQRLVQRTYNTVTTNNAVVPCLHRFDRAD